MRILSTLSLLLLCCSVSLRAQLVTVTGHVADQETGFALPGVTIAIGSYGTSTNASGDFLLTVQKNVAERYGISANCLGYHRLQVAYEKTSCQLKLLPDVRQLNTVLVSSTSQHIVQKAFSRIPENYPGKDVTITGWVHLLHSGQDTSGYQYFYQNNAIVQLYFPSYTNSQMPSIALMEKKDTVIQNPKAAFQVRFIGGYTSIPYNDVVHSRQDMLKGNRKNFTYRSNGKEWVNGNRVFVVNFFAKGNHELSGTLYIDTASYAFVKITFTEYHIKPAIFIGIDRRTAVVEYRKYGGHWLPDVVKINSVTRHGQFDLNRITEFQAAAIDTLRVKPLPYSWIIPDMMEDRNISGHIEAGFRTAGRILPLAKTKADSVFVNASVPKIATAGHPASASRFLDAYRRYVLHDNLRVLFGIHTLPFRVTGDQPALVKNLHGISRYVLNTALQLRLLPKKEFFLQLDSRWNFGIDGINTSETAYELMYGCVFNQKGRPITLSPVFGYVNSRVRYRKTDAYQQKSLLYGLTATCELSPRTSLYAAGQYCDAVYRQNGGLLVSDRPFSIGFGLLYKIKY